MIQSKNANKSWRTNRHKLTIFKSISIQPRRWAHI